MDLSSKSILTRPVSEDWTILEDSIEEVKLRFQETIFTLGNGFIGSRGILEEGYVQRFKLGLHGANHDIAAMIGYLQEGSASDWHDRINKWIVELSSGTIADVCVWNISEMLEKLEVDSSKGIANCRSTHNRSGSAQSNKILIRHLWITMHM